MKNELDKLNRIKKMVEKLSKCKDISTKSRKRDVSELRFIYFKLAFLKTKCSITDIGREVNRDHSTVLHGLTQIDNLISTDSLRHKDIYLSLYSIMENAQTKRIDKISIDIVQYKNEIKKLESDLEKKEVEILKINNEFGQLLGQDFKNDISNLNDNQRQIFFERVSTILKAVKSIRTHENTPKSHFNAKQS